LSQAIVAPPRPRVSESGRPTIGVALRSSSQGLVLSAASGNAHQAGLKAGDRIVRIGDRTSPTAAAFDAAIAGRREGDTGAIAAMRDETRVLATVRVAVKPVTPADIGLPFEEVAFRNGDGLTLRGWYVPPPAGTPGRVPAVAYGHGNGTDRRHW